MDEQHTPGEVTPARRLTDQFPATSDMAMLKRLEPPPGGSTPVRAAILIGVCTLCLAVAGLVFALFVVKNTSDEYKDQLACSRESAVAYDTAVGDGVRLVIEIVDGVATEDGAVLDAALDRTQVVLSSLDKAITARNDSLALCS